MSAFPEPSNLADVVRARAKALGDAIVYEFEGRQTSFAEFDIKTNRVANGLKALGVKPRERIGYLGKNSDIYFELLLGVMKPGRTASAADIINFTRERIAGYKTPKSVDFIDALPRNPSGKILRHHLRDPFWVGKERQIN
jgi:acyl-CoA synthetase (AMP-forming)/AMP-acid ligase II